MDILVKGRPKSSSFPFLLSSHDIDCSISVNIYRVFVFIILKSIRKDLHLHLRVHVCIIKKVANFSGHGEIFYFRDVTGIQLVINMIFFILTAKQCNKVKEELKKVTTDQSDPRNKQFLANKSKWVRNEIRTSIIYFTNKF